MPYMYVAKPSNKQYKSKPGKKKSTGKSKPKTTAKTTRSVRAALGGKLKLAVY